MILLTILLSLFIGMAMSQDSCAGCLTSLGMENGDISDAQISASTSWNSNHAPAQARLNFQETAVKAGSWAAAVNDVNQWLQIDLHDTDTVVARVASQGRDYSSSWYGPHFQWVTKYKLQYSNDGVSFDYYKEQGQTSAKEFNANSDRDTVVYHDLNPGINARYIRFLPTAWYGHISMRVEVYGC